MIKEIKTPEKVIVWKKEPLNRKRLIAYALIAIIVLIAIFGVIPDMSKAPQLSVSSDPLIFKFDSTYLGETISQEFLISNDGGGTLDWIISYNQPWMTIKPTNGSGSSNVTLKVDTSGLTPGNYAGDIIITSNGGTDTGIIYLNIIQIPSLSISPDPLSFNLGDINEGKTVSVEFSISNAGNGTLMWSVRDYQPYITANPIKGTNSGSVMLNINATDLNLGNHTKSIDVISNGGVKSGEIYFNIVPAKDIVQK